MSVGLPAAIVTGKSQDAETPVPSIYSLPVLGIKLTASTMA